MKRREFITLLGGAAAMWPPAARAQEGVKIARIGVLMNATADESESQLRLAAFREGLQKAGWIVGHDVQFETRWSNAGPAALRRHATELVALAPDAILAGTGGTVPPLQQATRTVPIVFAQAIDPVGTGFVRSLARPGGNITGFTQFEYSLSGKWPELLKQMAPGISRAGVIRDPATAAGIGQWAVIQAAVPRKVSASRRRGTPFGAVIILRLKARAHCSILPPSNLSSRRIHQTRHFEFNWPTDRRGCSWRFSMRLTLLALHA